MYELFLTAGWIIIILMLLFERVFFSEKQDKEKARLFDQIEKLQAALVAKNANEYVAMRAMDKVVTEDNTKKLETPDDVESTQLDDDEFDKMIERQNQ